MNIIDYGGVLGGGDMLLFEFSLKFVIWAPKKLFFFGKFAKLRIFGKLVKITFFIAPNLKIKTKTH